MDTLKEQFIRFKNLPFPRLGYKIGDFVLYDCLLAGRIDSYLKGISIKKDDIFVPDNETVSEVIAIRDKTKLSEDEEEFLLYFNELEAMRNKLIDLAK